MKDLYIIKYEPDGEGAPYFFDLNWTPDLPDFHYPTENPKDEALSLNYRAIANVPNISADWLPDHFLASKKFLEVCDFYGCKYLSRPVQLIIHGGHGVNKQYSFFAVVERLMGMDPANSIFVLDINSKLEDGGEAHKNYERIDKLVISEKIDSDLFYFQEIHEVVCSARFMNECQNKGIYGLRFSLIDKDYRYAPWDDF